jgi:hypothetical protein
MAVTAYRDELQQLPYIPAGNGGTQPSQLGGGNRSAARLSPALALALQRSQQMSLQVIEGGRGLMINRSGNRHPAFPDAVSFSGSVA